MGYTFTERYYKIDKYIKKKMKDMLNSVIYFYNRDFCRVLLLLNIITDL